jgi:hypothetical protein
MRSSSGPEIVAEETAGTRIHGGQQLEAGRKLRLSRGTGDADLSRLQWLAQHFEYIAVEFRQFVEKQHPVHRHRDLAGTRIAATAHQRDRRRSVVG